MGSLAGNPKVLKREKERARQDRQKEKDDRRRQRRLDRNARAGMPRDEMADIIPAVPPDPLPDQND